MKTLLLTLLLIGSQALAHDEPDTAKIEAQLDRIERKANYEAMRARQRAFMERAARDAQRHQARGMCAVNGSC